MSEAPTPPANVAERTLSAGQWGMLAFLLSEVAFFSTLIVAYVSCLGKDQAGPSPAEALHLPLVIGTTTLLLASSGTIHRAETALRRGAHGGFCGWWAATIGLGIAFLLGTAYEWHDLVTEYDLTPSRNRFGSAYYTLVGFHGLHVSAGVIVMLIVLGLALWRRLSEPSGAAVELVAWYWHFVDGVWIVVFTVVYVLGR